MTTYGAKNQFNLSNMSESNMSESDMSESMRKMEEPLAVAECVPCETRLAAE